MDNHVGGLGAALSTLSMAWAAWTVAQGGQEPSLADRLFLVSLPRVQASHQMVFVRVPLGQANSGRHLAPSLAARQSPALGVIGDPPAQCDPGAWQVTTPHSSWP